jgi:hypothetical protein
VGDYFGVPSLIAHVHGWIAEHHTVRTATQLWRYVQTAPAVSMQQDVPDRDMHALPPHTT